MGFVMCGHARFDGDGVLARVVKSRRDSVYENLVFRRRSVDTVSLLGNERED